MTGRPQASLRRLILTALAAGLSLAAAIAIAAILTHSFDALDARLIATSLGFSLFTALGGAGVGPRRCDGQIRHLGSATMCAAGVDFALLLTMVWLGSGEAVLWRAWAVLVLMTLAASHACLVLASRRQTDSPLIGALVVTSVGASSLDAALGALPISGLAEHVVDGNFVRLVAILVVVMLLTSVLPPILRRIPSRERPDPTGAPASPPQRSISLPGGREEDLLAIAGRLEALAPTTGDLARAIVSEAAHLRELAQSP